ncbi:phage tail length tape measure family protein [Kaistia defluvii]|uniref:phage tail length tape measure family protein n=1 Tax=Kaistia defluvii TaxID=410841 RepID=UPI0022564F61|nr:phage tail length tape measure family protein [Kaistia defluvii]MCX5518447.1 phage tail length tape measure family protein [Kaistia defluvii]
MASLEAIRQLTIRGRSEGLDKVAADLRLVDTAQKQVAASSGPLATVTDTVAKKVTSSAGAYDRLRQSIDLDYRAQLQMEKGQRTINAALEQGVIDAQGAANAIDMLTARYARLHGAMNVSVSPGQLIGAQESGASASASAAAFAAELDRLDQVAVLKAQQIGQNFNQALSTSFATTGKSARDSASVFEDVARAEDRMAREAAQLRAQLNPLGAALDQLNNELAQYSRLADAGAISATELTQAQAMARARYDDTAGSLTRMGGTSKLAAHEVTNLTYQLNDIATGLATGQSPFMILAQQSGQVSQIFGNRGIRTALVGTFQGLASMITPVTLGMAALAAGGYAASLVFRKMRGDSESLEDVLKRHQTVIQTLKASYGDAAPKLEAFAAEGRNVADALARIQRIDLETQLRKTAEAARIGFGDLARGASGGGFAIADQFKALEGPLNRFFESVRSGQPDVRKLRSEVANLANLDPTNEALGKSVKKLMEITDTANHAQGSLMGLTGGFDAAGSAARRNQTSLDNYANALKTISQIALPQLSDLEQVDRALETAIGSTASAADRAAAISLANEARQRIADSKVPLPRAKPNYLGANPDGSYGAAAGKAAEREANAYRDLIKNANDRIGQLQVEIQTVGMAEAAAEKYRMQQELLASATDKGREVSEPMRAEIEKIANEYADLAEQVAKARLQQDLLFDRRQLGRSSIDQTVASALRGAGLPEDLNSTEAQMIRLNEQLSIGKGMAMDFASSFISGLRDGQTVLESFGNALNRIADKLIEMATDQLISGLFGNLMGAFGGGGAAAITGGLFANGAAFSGGNVIPFAKGGVVSGPTTFPMSGGRTGLMGEDGSEAVVPLRRTSAGRLGIEAVGGGGGQGGNVVHFAPTTSIIVQGGADKDTLAQLKSELDRRDRAIKAELPGLVTKAQVRGQFQGRG